MRKLFGRVGICLILAAVVWCAGLLADRETLREELIRLHVVANSDSEEDQSVKLQVRDAVIASVQEDLSKVADVEEARAYLQENLPKIQSVANETLKSLGMEADAVATLCEEAFDTCYYDTFTLPAGVYEALRITIGEGAGRNWWCVAFPSLCVPATSEGVEDLAVGSGFSETLTKTLTEGTYEVRFFLLDALGKLENRFFGE